MITEGCGRQISIVVIREKLGNLIGQINTTVSHYDFVSSFGV